ncbi:hypothetical protein CPB83DRAFT_856393 [Crepidotus variabilis]|uniref:Vacuolar sorting protein Vps3844 C-terminal domain-containing protein n=1 Tax=Crepidotus variabilis TaxID=179855 RepID=A0A9P6JP12_9AGAR|nr:hypothetical protein CPB83DRAFT_856393 [Crepidotus variabilis]
MMLAPFSLCLLLTTALGTANAVYVYLSPPQDFLRSTLSPEDASAAVSRHLGLEAFEAMRDMSNTLYEEDNTFVGQGGRHGLILTLEEDDVTAILPSSLRPAFSLATPPDTPIYSLSTVARTYLHRASHSYASVFPSMEILAPKHVEQLSAFFESVEDARFAALDLSSLRHLGEGRYSKEYAEVSREMRAFLERIAEDDGFSLAVFTYATPWSTSLMKRSPAVQSQAPLPSTAPPQQPIGGVSTCFTTVDACNNGTSTCSGKGQCVKAAKAGHECFVCTCGKTTTGDGTAIKTEYWAGEKCERKDISGPFVLLTGTVIVILLLIAGSVSLLYTIGDQPLPSTLLATAVNAKKE